MKINDSRKWLMAVSLFFLFTITLIGSINYIVDPYGLNHSVKEKEFNLYKKSNIGYTFRLKTKAYERRKFTNLMLGTSRVGVMNPEVVDDFLGGLTFNFSAPGSITPIHKEVFFYAIKNKNIKNVIYGIDFLSLNGALKIKERFQEFSFIKENLAKNWDISNFDLYYNIDTLKDSFEIIKTNVNGNVLREKRYLYENGMRDYMNYVHSEMQGEHNIDKEIQHNIRSYYHMDRKGGYQNYTFSYEYLNHIKEIVDYCKNNNINLWIYIPPMYKEHFNGLRPYGIYDEFELFKRELVQITDFIDFTGPTMISNDKKYFWDGSHLKSQYTKLVMQHILDDTNNSLKENLGVYVSKNNIESHLKVLSDSIKPFDMEALLRSKE